MGSLKKYLPLFHSCYLNKFFEIFSSPLRIKIIEMLLLKKEATVKQMIETLGEEQSKISHALQVMRKCHIVSFERRGRENYYKLNTNTILPLLEVIAHHKHTSCKECLIK